MSYKLIGMVLVMAGCGGWGFICAAQYLRRITRLRQLVGVLDYMECELQYRSTALPLLCRQASMVCKGRISQVFQRFSEELETQISTDVECCMASALGKVEGLCPIMLYQFRELGSVLGRFDLQGQLRGLERIRAECRQKLTTLQHNHEVRVRSYQTLGLCAGAALAILFI